MKNTSHQSSFCYFICLVSVKIAFFNLLAVHRVHIIKKTTGQREKKTNRKTLKRTKTIFTLVFFFQLKWKRFFKGPLTRFSLAFIVHFQTDSHVILSRYTTGYHYFLSLTLNFSLFFSFVKNKIKCIVNTTLKWVNI